jgi:hypothetical protein
MPGEIVYRDANGGVIPLRAVGADCGPREDYFTCLERGGVSSVELQYQPESNFWPLQAIQSGIAVILSAVVLGGSYARAGRLG